MNDRELPPLPMLDLSRDNLYGYTADQMRAYAEMHAATDNAALRERVKVLEDALRHVDDCLSINDYGDYVLLSRFDSEIVRAALEASA